MSGLLYYLSGARAKPTDAELIEVGLAGQVVGGLCPTEIFLDNTRGIVFTIKGRYSTDLKIGFYHDEQVWTNIPEKNGNQGRLWVGYYKNNKPKPKDFLRKDYIKGTEIILGDGNSWEIPIAISFENNLCTLPKSIVQYREDSEPEYVVIGKFLDLKIIADKMAELFGLFDNGKRDELRDFYKYFKNQMPVCAKILSYNYNVSLIEISVLGLFTTDNTLAIMREVVDGTFIDEQEKQIRQEYENSEKKKLEDLTDGKKD